MELKESLTTDQLIAFLRIIKDGSFSRAAESLDIGQPAISSRVKALEVSVGGRLFTRGRQVALTKLGESFVPYARRALEVLSEGIDAAHLLSSGKAGRVRFGVLGSLCEALLGSALQEFVHEHPLVECFARSGDQESVVQWLLDGIVDLGLIVWPSNHVYVPDFAPLLLLEEPVIMATHPEHPLARMKETTQDDVVRLVRPFYLLRWWQNHHPDILRLTRTSTRIEIPKEAARYLVLSGIGGGFFPEGFIASALNDGTMKRISIQDLPSLTRTIALVSKTPPSELSPSCRSLIVSIKKQARALGFC